MAGDGTVKLIDEKGKRLDGRTVNDLRPTEIKIGVVKNADGSAEIRMGKNIIIAAVYGPRELHPKHRALPHRALIQCFYRMSTFSVNDRKSPAPSRREKEISMILANALTSVVLTEKYPRTTVDVYLQVLQADGGTRCASLTAASVALADAGVPMRGIISSVASGLINDKVAQDLDDIEDQKGSGDMPLGYCPTLNEVSLFQLDGVFTLEQFDECLDLSIEGAKKLHTMQTDALKQKYTDIRAEVSDDDELAKEKVKPVVKDETKPVAKDETKPVAKDETKPVAKDETKPVAKDETKPVAKDETKEKSGDE